MSSQRSVSRPSKDETWITVAMVIAKRGTCARRKVGCVLVDAMGDVLSTGYNGTARGLPHCIEHPCDGAAFKSGEGLAQCHAIHAEQNALMQCGDVQAIDTCYVTTSPCQHCVKMLMNTGCKRIVFLELYADANDSMLLWVRKPNAEWSRFIPPHPREFGNISW